MKSKHYLQHGLLIIVLMAGLSNARAQQTNSYLKVGPQPDGSTLVPSNQFLRPAGTQVYLPGRPVDLALIANQSLLLVKNMKSLDLVRLSDRTVVQTLPYGKGFLPPQLVT